MNNYPEYVPSEFIRYYEFEFTGQEEKDVIHKMIFDERMAFSWSALEKRANECHIPYFFYQSLVFTIVEISKGPSEWDLLTQKEKEAKINRISNLASQLSNEIEETPLDCSLTEYFNHKFYIEWFKTHNKDENAIRRMDYYLHTYCIENENSYVSRDFDIGVASAWSGAGVSAPYISSMLTDLWVKAGGFESKSIVKRKKNPRKSFFVRRLSAFFDEYFNLKLYALTANISSIFLDEDISQDEVKSITK